MKKVLLWDITGKCNLNCKYCYKYETLKNYNSEMSLKDCVQFIDIIPPETHVHILGGEPFMKNDFIDILKYLTKQQISYSIVTNGTLLNRNLICDIMKTSITNIVFSIEGPNETTHEKIRGKNTFQKMLASVVLFSRIVYEYKQNIKITVNITINKFNYKLINKFYEFLEKVEIDEIVFKRVQQQGNTLNNALKITDECWINTCENIAAASIKSNISTVLYGKPLLLSYLNTKYNTNFQLDTFTCKLLNNTILMYVRSDGAVFPCDKWYKIKKIYNSSINNSVKNMTADDIKNYKFNNEMYKQIINLKNNADKYRESLCINCNFKKLCSGCILDFNENNKLITDLNECIEVNRRIKKYKISV